MIKILSEVKRASQCSRCGVWFSFEREDCKVDHDRDGDYLILACPGCGAGLTVGPA